jgi:hypothetical protein
MSDLSKYSDAELEQIANQPDLSSVSDEELARIAGEQPQRTSQQQPSFLSQLGQSFVNAPANLARGVAEPLVKATGAAGLGIESMLSGKPVMPGYDVPFPGGAIPVRPMKTLPQAIGLGVQGGSLAMGANPALAGASYGGGQGLAEQKSGIEVAGQAGLGGLLGGLFGLASGQYKTPDLLKWTKPKNQVGLAQEARGALSGIKQGAVETYGTNYGEVVNKSDKVINLKAIVNDFNQNEGNLADIKMYKDITEAVGLKDAKAERLMKVLNSENIPENLSVQEADKFQQFIKNLPGIKSKLQKGAGFGNFDNSERMLLDLANNIKASIIEAHPEIQGIKTDYGQTMNAIKLMRGKLTQGNTINNLQNFGRLDPEVQQAFTTYMPKNIMNKIGSFDTASKVGNILKWAGLTAVGGGIAGGTAREVFKK